MGEAGETSSGPQTTVVTFSCLIHVLILLLYTLWVIIFTSHCAHAYTFPVVHPYYLNFISHLQRRPCPEEDAHFLSRITWWWQNRQIWNGWRRPIKYDDLADLNAVDKSRVIAPRFQKNWDRELKKAGLVWLDCSLLYPIHFYFSLSLSLSLPLPLPLPLSLSAPSLSSPSLYF